MDGMSPGGDEIEVLCNKCGKIMETGKYIVFYDNHQIINVVYYCTLHGDWNDTAGEMNL